jgi:hypothetical protein
MAAEFSTKEWAQLFRGQIRLQPSLWEGAGAEIAVWLKRSHKNEVRAREHLTVRETKWKFT